ncbi:MAG: glycosyltransferase [Chitinophagaceae bacterium]
MENSLSSRLDICVLIPCYNNNEGLQKTLKSITYNNQRLTVLVVDDGSTEPVAIDQHLPYSFSTSVLRLSKNQGIITALNKGLEYIYTNLDVKYIARLDCGDICHPDRFLKQVNFLENNQEIDLVGSWCYFEDFSNGKGYEYRTPTNHNAIVKGMYFRNVFVHPTVMWRTSVLKKERYPALYPHAEDYGLFYDIVVKRLTAIIPEFLVTCEINRKGISLTHRQEQLKSRLKVVKDFGKNKLLLAAGVIKMVILIALPYKLIYIVKSKLYEHK